MQLCYQIVVKFLMRDLSTNQNPGYGYRFLTAPWIWACGATWLFYSQIPNFPVGQELALRYFCGHPLERVLMALFFVGFSIICIKAVLMIFELKAFYRVPDFGIKEVSDDLDQNVTRFQNRLTSASTELQNTHWGRRLDHLLAFFKGRRTEQGLSEHLTYLSEASADRLHSSHALLQTVIWSIPILGFLGTVMGITLAIANVTPDQLDTSLNEVTSGLSVAFDTTALALLLSLILGFASLFVKRIEENLLSEIDERCRLEVNRCFPIGPENNHPLFEAEAKASQTLLEQTAAMIARQTTAWSSSLEELRQQWSSTLLQQQEALTEALNEGTNNTLTNHARQLAEYREQFLSSQETMTLAFVKEMHEIGAGRHASEQELFESIQSLTESLKANAAATSQHQNENLDVLLTSFADRIEDWQTKTEAWQHHMEQLTLAVTVQSTTLSQHGSQLEKIVGQEESLLRLQGQLDQNLETLHTAETFEQTLHNLTAAVNLLTARSSRSRDAA